MNAVLSTKDRQGERSACAAPDFDWLVPSKRWFNLREVAAITGLSESTIENFYDEGRLLYGHSYCAGAGLRFAKRVPRSSVISFLVKTADYDAETKLQAFTSCLPEFTAAQLRQIATLAECLFAKKVREKTWETAKT
jgi:hypothetical protein